ncbi:RHS repeat domain-containing protein [Streptomyces sp. KMM 9044]|uniref:RHS repeat domain-containing protein n=1 Tax=Streptomyces sp. KMM 9044 TaxID=2744474 RepID=UPI0022B22417|nr:RHS repeat-associated core domain-containing protein [Streptomyces sp. KMM 9044]WAX79356.1 RHS repeat-associated core domain-containing protein [Streptomyces sp. KMM 9044]
MGATELHVRAGGSTWAQRHYGSGGLTVAVRSNESGSNELSYLVTDQHGTATLAIDATDQAFSRRYTTPFGAPRGSVTGSAWPDDKGFLGKTTDTGTGLTHVDARQYDAETGQFISVDPLLQTGVGQTLNGYSYAVQNPATVADPSGLGVPECNEPQKYGITCRGGIPVSSGKKKATSSSGEGPVRACRCGSRPPLVKGMKPTGLGGIPGSRNLTLPSTPAPKGWLKKTPSVLKPKKGPSPVEDFVGGVIHKALSSNSEILGGMLADLTGYDRTQGACINGSASAGFGFSARGCFMVMQTSQGYEVGFAGSLGPSIGSPGAGIPSTVTGATRATMICARGEPVPRSAWALLSADVRPGVRVVPALRTERWWANSSSESAPTSSLPTFRADRPIHGSVNGDSHISGGKVTDLAKEELSMGATAPALQRRTLLPRGRCLVSGQCGKA